MARGAQGGGRRRVAADGVARRGQVAPSAQQRRGALVAIERGDRDVVALIKHERLNDRAPLTHGAVVGQVWRGGRGRQANLARLLPGVEVHAIDDRLGRQAGVLLGVARGKDVIDAALVLLASDGDHILTSDPGDLAGLARAAGRHIELIPV